jgi:hypothetical protein
VSGVDLEEMLGYLQLVFYFHQSSLNLLVEFVLVHFVQNVELLQSLVVEPSLMSGLALASCQAFLFAALGSSEFNLAEIWEMLRALIPSVGLFAMGTGVQYFCVCFAYIYAVFKIPQRFPKAHIFAALFFED